MRTNPQVTHSAEGYAVRFTRSNWKVLAWVQDLTARKMKAEAVERPVVLFSTREEAEAEVRSTIIPYLIAEKDVPPEDIIGW